MKGIDVSSHQATINWLAVKSNIDFAIIRCGYGDNATNQDDSQFLNNVNGCISNNIPFGIYLYSYAKNLTGSESIESEIAHVKRLLNSITTKPFCVYIDMEDDSTTSLGKPTLTNFATTFCQQITNLGYKAGVYANENWFKKYLDVAKISNQGYSIWCAKYSTNKPNIASNYDIWQYSSTGSISGITSNVDMDEMTNDIRNVSTQPTTTTSRAINVYYRVKTQAHGWLPEVKNLNDYAGYQNSPITGLAIKVDKGSIKYKVHLKGKNWLPYVTGYDTTNIANGYAGNGRDIIDTIEVCYNTHDTIRPYKKAKYKVNDYNWQYDNEKTNNQDGYAGVLGVSATKFQIVIE